MENLDELTLHWLRDQLGAGFQIEKHGFSNQDEVYKIKAVKNSYYLKMNQSLRAEHDNILKLQPHLSVPEIAGYTNITNKDHLLPTDVQGKNLAELGDEWDISTVINEFAKAVRQFHNLNVADIFPDSHSPHDSVLLHGDMAMPNIIFTEPGSPSYIDLGQMTVGNPDKDLADAIWSLQRNIGPGHGEEFLAAYGDFVMTESIEKMLKFRYSPE